MIPLSIIVVDWEGNFCTFSPELLGHRSDRYGQFALGNIASHSFKDAINTSHFIEMFHDINKGVKLCRSSCEFFELCGGEAPSNKFFETGSFRAAETMYCRNSIQLPLRVVLGDLERSLPGQIQAR
jgi:uncharacterized protein